jgi:hypothetical protein
MDDLIRPLTDGHNHNELDLEDLWAMTGGSNSNHNEVSIEDLVWPLQEPNNRSAFESR